MIAALLRPGGIMGLAVLNSFLHFAGADTFGADIGTGGLAIRYDADFLQVWIKPAPGGAVGMTPVISISGFFAADCTDF